MWVFDFFPVADAAPIEYSVAGDVLTVNGVAYDFGALGEAEIIPADAITGAADWLRSTEVTRWEGVLRACVVMPYDSTANLPHHVRHPGPVTVEAGRVPLPTDEVAE